MPVPQPIAIGYGDTGPVAGSGSGFALFGEITLKNNTPVYTAPFPRDGEAAVFNVEALQLEGSVSNPFISIDIEHHNVDDFETSAWIKKTSLTDLTSAGQLDTALVNGLAQEYRLKITMSGGYFGRLFFHNVLWRP